MFYCKPCGQAANWPIDIWIFKSVGACEMCGVTAVCMDVSSSHLPDITDRTAFLAKRHAGEHKIAEEP